MTKPKRKEKNNFFVIIFYLVVGNIFLSPIMYASAINDILYVFEENNYEMIYRVSLNTNFTHFQRFRIQKPIVNQNGVNLTIYSSIFQTSNPEANFNDTDKYEQIAKNNYYINSSAASQINLFWIYPLQSNFSQIITTNSVDEFRLRKDLIEFWGINDSTITDESNTYYFENQNLTAFIINELMLDSGGPTKIVYTGSLNLILNANTHIIETCVQLYQQIRYCGDAACNIETSVYKYELVYYGIYVEDLNENNPNIRGFSLFLILGLFAITSNLVKNKRQHNRIHLIQ